MTDLRNVRPCDKGRLWETTDLRNVCPMRQRQLVDDDGTPQRAPMRQRQMVNNQGNRGIEDPDDVDEAARRCFPNHREYRLHAASLVHSQEARSTDMCVLTLLSAAMECAFQA